VDGYIAMSHEVFADIEKFVKNPLRRFSPHPVYDHYGEIVSREEALKALQLDPQYRYLLFFGFIRDYKGLDWLLQSLADERLSRLPLRLIVAGEFYSDNGPYLRLIKELGIQEKVVLKADYIPNDQINNYFCAADLLVQPYKTATQSGVTQIGYHFHKAMLVTDVGGLGEIIAHQKSGYVVKPEISAIADAIVDFYTHDRQLPFETETIRMKEQFSWSHMTDVLMDLLHEINKSKG
jgi:glycosyltransferase involved in cell wall biosynthesis